MSTPVAQHEVTTQWMGKMQFNALVNGHTVIMDAPERAGGEDNGPIPKPFVLTAFSGCTGMDVISRLHKEGHDISDLSINVRATLSQSQPITYTAIHLIYDFKGQEKLESKTMEAVLLSQEKYCGVSSMLKKAMPITWEIRYNGKKVFDNSTACDLTSYSR